MYNNILTQIKTVKDVGLLQDEIELLLASQYRQEEGFDETLAKKVRETIATELGKIVYGQGVDREKVLKDLLEELKRLRVLQLTIAFEPTKEIIGDIYAWVNQNLGSDVVLDIFYNDSLIGGAIIAFEGKYADFSLSRKLIDERV